MDSQKQYFSSEDFILMEGTPGPEAVKRMVDFMCDALGLTPGSKVLDAGCGVGKFAIELASRGCQVTAIDSSDYMVEKCREFSSGLPLTAIKMTCETMEFSNEFDAVISWGHSLGYGTREDDLEAIKRMHEALIPCGKLLLDLHNLSGYLNYFVGRHWEERETAFALRDVEFDGADHKFVCRNIIVPKDCSPSRESTLEILEYQPEEIESILKSTGFSDITFYGDSVSSPEGLMFSREGFDAESASMIVISEKENI